MGRPETGLTIFLHAAANQAIPVKHNFKDNQPHCPGIVTFHQTQCFIDERVEYFPELEEASTFSSVG